MAVKQPNRPNQFTKLAPELFEKVQEPVVTDEVKKEEPLVEVVFYKFDFYLIVINPFGGYNKGQMISEDDPIQKVIDDGNLPNCRKCKRG
jgi:hypothetical protein